MQIKLAVAATAFVCKHASRILRRLTKEKAMSNFGFLLYIPLLIILFLPLILFFRVMHKLKRLDIPPDGEQRSKHAAESRYYLLTSVGLAVSLLVFSPMTASMLKSTHHGTNTFYLSMVESVPVFLVRCIFVAMLTKTSISGIRHAKAAADLTPGHTAYQTLAILTGYFAFLAACIMSAGHAIGGLAWGRPLRVSGKIIKPELTRGSEWAHGEVPDATRLDSATKLVLEALWLHDAKKEYASVPAFSRLGWQMAALAAPPELLRDIHIAAIQEIDHTRKCFALAAGFGTHEWTVVPIPEMLSDTGSIKNNPFVVLAIESLGDGCLLEGFNADIAEHSALICEDAASLKVIRQIAREERAHAELSWRIVDFCFTSDPDKVGPALENEMKNLAKAARPTASSSQNIALISEANAQHLQEFGRLPDSSFDKIWWPRVADTKDRLARLIENNRAETEEGQLLAISA